MEIDVCSSSSTERADRMILLCLTGKGICSGPLVPQNVKCTLDAVRVGLPLLKRAEKVWEGEPCGSDEVLQYNQFIGHGKRKSQPTPHALWRIA